MTQRVTRSQGHLMLLLTLLMCWLLPAFIADSNSWIICSKFVGSICNETCSTSSKFSLLLSARSIVKEDVTWLSNDLDAVCTWNLHSIFRYCGDFNPMLQRAWVISDCLTSWSLLNNIFPSSLKPKDVTNSRNLSVHNRCLLLSTSKLIKASTELRIVSGSTWSFSENKQINKIS